MAAKLSCKLLVSSLRLEARAAPRTAPCMVVLWHEEIFAAYKYFANARAVAMVSPSGDGRLAGWLCAAMGIDVVYASSNKNPMLGLLKLLRSAADYQYVLFAADGPRGPRQQLKPGVLWLARQLRYPLLTARFGMSGWRLSSWDKMLVPIPCSRVRVCIAEHEAPATDADITKLKQIYQQHMQQTPWT